MILLRAANARASSVIRIKISRREQKRPKQFKKYLGHGCNKVDLVKFLLLDWSDCTRFKQIISGRVIFVTVESDCHRIYVDEDVVKCSREEELSSNQEEADTKMFLCRPGPPREILGKKFFPGPYDVIIEKFNEQILFTISM